jgi:hypothetical protein
MISPRSATTPVSQAGTCGWSGSVTDRRTASASSRRVSGPSGEGGAHGGGDLLGADAQLRDPPRALAEPDRAQQRDHPARILAGIRCSVPRMTHVRATERSSNRAASTSANVLPGRRARTPSAAAPASCACKAATAATVSETVLRGWAARRWPRANRARARSGGRVRAMAKRSPMSSLQASRTLVKSPPELWAELSDLGSLARHLGEFGEIRITKTDPESRVEWEADRASGTVRLEPSGWGTRVVLTVDTPEPAADPEPEPEAAPVAEAAPEPVEPDPTRSRWPRHRSWSRPPRSRAQARLLGPPLRAQEARRARPGA